MHTTLIGFRFLALLGHILVTALLLSGRVVYPKDVDLLVSLSLTIAGIILELLALLSGVSMLSKAQCLFSLCAHSVATLCMLVFILDHAAATATAAAAAPAAAVVVVPVPVPTDSSWSWWLLGLTLCSLVSEFVVLARACLPPGVHYIRE